ncbi:hypothetical protein [Aneurinibacillus aneurinilyticus]
METFVKDGSMPVPLRSTLEALRAKVEWDLGTPNPRRLRHFLLT